MKGLDFTLRILYCWAMLGSIEPSLLNVGSNQLTTSIILNSKDGNIITQSNFDKLSSKATPYPIICGETNDIGPFCTIRFIDSKHNIKERLPAKTKSLIVVQIVSIPFVGIEPAVTIFRHVKRPGGYPMIKEDMFGMDGGIYVARFISKLVAGQLDGMKIE